MKRVVLILLFLSNGLVKAQTYHPFPTDSATWSQITINYGAFGAIECMGTKHFGLVGDTIIQNLEYSRLYGINYNMQNYIDVDHFIIDSAAYVGAIREDSSKKVYILMENDTTEHLLYDFSLNVGDTFNVWSPSYAITETVSAIDSTLVDGAYRRTIYFTGELEWIEGVGNSMGWFEYTFNGTFDWYLSCFSENDELVYVGGTDCSCTPWSGISKANSDEFIVLFPNPTTSTITIELPQNHLVEINIYNTVGKNVISQKTSSSQITIDVNDLVSGTYFIRCVSDKNVYTTCPPRWKSFIKQ